MPEYCPKCEEEILPYLKTGELKKIHDHMLIKYQLYWCVKCRVVYYNEHERQEFINLKPLKLKKEILDAITRKSKEISKRTG